MSRLTFEAINISAGDKHVVNDVSFSVNSGEVQILMGPNGSGKSTLVNGVMGHPKYTVNSGRLMLDELDITDESPDKKALRGIFLSQQYLPEIPGVTLNNFLYKAQKNIRPEEELSVLDFYRRAEARAKDAGIDPSFLKRQVGAGLSGGEKKQAEMLQAIVLDPKFVLLDEIDSGVDIDAMNAILSAIEYLRLRGVGVLIITHYDTIIKRISPTAVHVMKEGKLVLSGGEEVVAHVREQGFQNL